MDTIQTRELLIAVLSLTSSIAEAKRDDGKISKPEAVGILFGNMGKIYTAVSGIGQVPAELRDLSPEELDELYQLAATSQGLIRTADVEDILASVYEAVRQIFVSTRRIQNIKHPPRAEPVT